MFKQTALITWQPEGSADTRAAILAAAEKSVTGASLSRFAPTVAGSHQGGDVVWHLHFSGKAVWEASGLAAALDWLSAEPEVSVLDACAYETSRYGVLAPDIQGGIYRTLFVGVDETASAEAALQFADELAGMPEYISEILNWGMNPVLQSRGRLRWTHVWEQEFSDISGLLGPYMTNPYHWAFVDRWFDQEMPCQIVQNGALCHSASVLETSVIALYGS
jgi:hypothetical protein